MRIIFSCQVQGDTFRPSEAESRSGVRFSVKNEVGEIGESGRFRGKPQPYGFGSLETQIWDNDLELPLGHFLEQVQQCLPIWRDLGAESAILQISVYYEHQCNLEISESVIAALHKLGLPVAVSCYQETITETEVSNAR